MPRAIRIRVGSSEFTGSLTEGPTADAVHALLPVTSTVHRSGGEVAVEIELECSPEEHARNRMLVGEIAFWPPGQTLSFFCGPTPLSVAERGDAASGDVECGAPQPGGSAQPIASSAVTPIGRVDDPQALAEAAQSGVELTVEAAG